MKATKATIALRVSEIARIRLDGAMPLDIREYVTEQQTRHGPWKLAEGEKPLSDSQLARYTSRADALNAEAARESNQRAFRRHMAQRRHLYGRAMLRGDVKTALAVLRDEAELRGLYPDPNRELDDLVQRLEAKLAELEGAKRGGTQPTQETARPGAAS
jgi:hypothetical protein